MGYNIRGVKLSLLSNPVILTAVTLFDTTNAISSIYQSSFMFSFFEIKL